MKTSLTQRQLLQISRQTGMSFDFRMSKKGMLQWVDAGLNNTCSCCDGLTCDRNYSAEAFALAVVEADDGHTWVHYREDLGIKVPTLQCKEYSCYLESFTQRFNERVN